MKREKDGQKKGEPRKQDEMEETEAEIWKILEKRKMTERKEEEKKEKEETYFK